MVVSFRLMYPCRMMCLTACFNVIPSSSEGPAWRAFSSHPYYLTCGRFAYRRVKPGKVWVNKPSFVSLIIFTMSKKKMREKSDMFLSIYSKIKKIKPYCQFWFGLPNIGQYYTVKYNTNIFNSSYEIRGFGLFYFVFLFCLWQRPWHILVDALCSCLARSSFFFEHLPQLTLHWKFPQFVLSLILFFFFGFVYNLIEYFFVLFNYAIRCPNSTNKHEYNSNGMENGNSIDCISVVSELIVCIVYV